MSRSAIGMIAVLLLSACATAPREERSNLELAEREAGAPSTTVEAAKWGEGSGKSYLVPAADIVGFQLLLNLFDRNFAEEEDYDSDSSSIQANLRKGWVIDQDPFATNQFLHPYQGSMYHGFARSAGLNYWEALGYDFAGSALWEVAGETVPPSLNDQITTTFGGSFLGEAFFRMASLVLTSEGTQVGFWRELGAALISPATGFNRLAFGDRFDAVFPSHDPATMMLAGVGGRRNAKLQDVGDVSNVQKDEAVADFAIEYGLPGKPGYEYTRPFDYFHFDATVASSSHTLPESVIVRGMLCGTTYEAGDSYRGIWGLYGSYDYITPEAFSVSSTALSLGTTGQWWISDGVAMQGSVLGGAGWTAVGTIADASEDRDYSYGWSPQGVVALRFIFSDWVMLDISGQDYYVDGTGRGGSGGNENIVRGQAQLTVRVYGHNALRLQFVETRRDASLSDLPDSLQSVGAVSFFYTYLSDTKLGAVEWR